MCGIVGFTNKIDDASAVLEKMMDRIKHRGPDSEGKFIDDNIAMGFRRLSIIDLSDVGSQPIFNEDRTLVLEVRWLESCRVHRITFNALGSGAQITTSRLPVGGFDVPEETALASIESTRS